MAAITFIIGLVAGAFAWHKLLEEEDRQDKDGGSWA